MWRHCLWGLVGVLLLLGCDPPLAVDPDAGPPMPDPVVLTVETSAGGAVRVAPFGEDCAGECVLTVDHGRTVTLRAVPDADHRFGAWTGACASVTGHECTLTLTEDTRAGAAFALREDGVTVMRAGDGDGTITSTPDGIDCGATCEHAFARGSAVTLRAAAADGSDFEGWSGDCAGAEDCALMVDGSRVAIATFRLRRYTLEIAKTGPGRVVADLGAIDCGPSCAADYPHGARVTLTAIPESSGRFAGWSGACAAAGSDPTCVVDVTEPLAVDGMFEAAAFVPTHLSATDRDPGLRIRDDGLAADFEEQGGVRSDRAIPSGSGVSYFEARRLTDALDLYGVGVATDTVPVTGPSAFVGTNDQTFGADPSGAIRYDGAWVGGFDGALVDRYGFVVDYRGATPTVHFIAVDGSGPAIVHSQPMPAVTTPLYIYLAGTKRTVGYEVEINPGHDTTNFPFFYDPEALLRAAGMGEVADALVLGWGGTRRRAPDDAPVLSPSADLTVSAGTPVTVSVAATDTEDGDMTADVRWELLSTPYYAGRLTGRGGTFSFTPTEIGVHPARAWVRDSAGQLSEVVVEVTVSGPVAQHDPVRLEPDPLSGAGVVLSPDGLSARWTGLGKMGIRANQSNYGRFWYFETERLVAPRNQGGGLVVGNGDLNPYDWAHVPQSCSTNNGGGIWRNIMWQANFPDPDPASYTHYGFAVDYRGRHPIVYVIVGGAVAQELYLDDVWTEIHPMLYGNPSSTASGDYDETINFGGSPFFYDPAAALTAHGVDVTAFELGWGDASLRAR